MHTPLRTLIGRGVLAVRGMGLWAGGYRSRPGTGKEISLEAAPNAACWSRTRMARRCASLHRCDSAEESTGRSTNSPSSGRSGIRLLQYLKYLGAQEAA